VLLDLEYADRLSTDSGQAVDPQVWLSSTAPADAVDRLAARGVIVLDTVTTAQVARRLDEQGPALAMWFYLLTAALVTALAAGILVLAAAVDRARRVEDLSALRVQGLARVPASRATVWAYPALVAASVVAGTAIGLAGWWLTGWALPLNGINPPALPLPGWPRVPAVAAPVLLVLVVLAGAAFVAGRRTRVKVR
jgi:predicted lysophospholipase L1 biosynthesis ABC-type transport system permease subunit